MRKKSPLASKLERGEQPEERAGTVVSGALGLRCGFPESKKKKKHKEARVMSGLCFFEKGCVVGDSRRKDVVAFACKIEFRYICRFK